MDEKILAILLMIDLQPIAKILKKFGDKDFIKNNDRGYYI